MPTVSVERDAKEQTTEAIAHGLRTFNSAFIDVAPAVPFNVVMRDEDGTIVGGCACSVRWHWLWVDQLWIDERFRKQGFGEALLSAAEAEARRRGCTKAHLDTLSYQARPFYEKLGWAVFGTLEDNPPGHTRYFLQKDISTSTPD
jgi:GNAT superfamily N-acetyltransferase